MIDLEQRADEAELAFIEAARKAKTEADDAHVKELCGEYLNVLKLMRLKRDAVGKMLSLRPYQNALGQPHSSVNHIAMADNWRIPPELEIYFPRTAG